MTRSTSPPSTGDSEEQALFFSLMERFLAEDLSEDEAWQLVGLTEKHEGLTQQLRRQLLVHELLRVRIAFPEFYQWTEGEWLELFDLPNETESPSPTGGRTKKTRSFSRSRRNRFRRQRRASRRAGLFQRAETIGRRCLSLLLIGLFCTLAGALYLEVRDDGKEPEIVAHLTNSKYAVWEDPLRIPAPGGPIFDRYYRLIDGVAVVKLPDGAEIVLEGPTELKFESIRKIRLRKGNLNAEVPPQREKLVIATPQMDINVLGTSFHVEVDDRQTDVHLIRGRLALENSDHGRFLIDGMEAFSLSRTDKTKRFAALPEKFVPAIRMDLRAEELAAAHLAAWREESWKINEREDLLVRFDFEEGEGDRVDNLSIYGHKYLPSAKLEEASLGDGRWPAKNAVLFEKDTSRIPLQWNRPLEKATLFVSMRVDSLERIYNGILMSNASNTSRGLGRFHWQITKEGTVRAGIGPRDGKVIKSDISPVVVTPKQYGQWFKLAVTIDTTAGRISHYLNGKKVSEGTIEHGKPLVIGAAHLGFWLPEDDQKPTRTLRGAMDEFMLFRRVLLPEEIKGL